MLYLTKVLGKLIPGSHRTVTSFNSRFNEPLKLLTYICVLLLVCLLICYNGTRGDKRGSAVAMFGYSLRYN